MYSAVLTMALSLALSAIGATAESVFASAVDLRDAGNQIEALRQFRVAARLNPKLPHVHSEIGLILLDRRDFAGAVSAFRSAVQQDRGDLQSRYNLALSLTNGGQKQAGIHELKQLLGERPNWGLAWFGLGHIYASQGRPADAESALRKAVVLDSQLHRAYFELGKLLADKKDLAGAIESISAGLRAAPNSAAMHFQLAKFLRESGREEEAEREFLIVRKLQNSKLHGEQAAAAYSRATRLLQVDDYEGAIHELTTAIDLRPDFPETQAALANAHEGLGAKKEQAGDTEGALEHYLAALDYAATPEVANHVGVLLAKSGRTQEAIPFFRRALSMNPTFKNAEQNLQRALAMPDGSKP